MEMLVSDAVRLLREQDTRPRWVMEHYVEEAQRKQNWSKVKRVLADETSARRGHRYVSCFVDADTRKLLFLAECRGSEVLGEFVEALRAHRGAPEQIELVAMDMGGAYLKGAREHLPKQRWSIITFT